MAEGGRWPRAAKHQRASKELLGDGQAAQVALAEVAGVVEAPGLVEHGAGEVEAHDFGSGEPEQGGVAAGAAAGIEDAWAGVRRRCGQADKALGFVRGGVVVDAAGVVRRHALVGGAVGANPGVGVVGRSVGRTRGVGHGCASP